MLFSHRDWRSSKVPWYKVRKFYKQKWFSAVIGQFPKFRSSWQHRILPCSTIRQSFHLLIILSVDILVRENIHTCKLLPEHSKQEDMPSSTTWHESPFPCISRLWTCVLASSILASPCFLSSHQQPPSEVSSAQQNIRRRMGPASNDAQ